MYPSNLNYSNLTINDWCSLAGLNVTVIKVPSEEEVILNNRDDSKFLQFIVCGSWQDFAVSFEIRINGNDGVEYTIFPTNNSTLGYDRDAEEYGITSTTLMRRSLDTFEMCKDILVRVLCHHRYITMHSPIRIEFVHTRTHTHPPSQSITSGGNFSLRFQEPPPTTVASTSTTPTIVSTAFPTTFSITTFNIGTTQSQIGQIGSSFKATIALCCVLVTIVVTIVVTLVIVLIYNKYRSKCRSGQEDLEEPYEATSPSKSEDPAEVDQGSEHSLHSADADVDISTAPLSNSSEN